MGTWGTYTSERERKKAANDREKEKENLGGDERGAQSITHTHTRALSYTDQFWGRLKSKKRKKSKKT